MVSSPLQVTILFPPNIHRLIYVPTYLHFISFVAEPFCPFCPHIPALVLSPHQQTATTHKSNKTKSPTWLPFANQLKYTILNPRTIREIRENEWHSLYYRLVARNTSGILRVFDPIPASLYPTHMLVGSWARTKTQPAPRKSSSISN